MNSQDSVTLTSRLAQSKVPVVLLLGVATAVAMRIALGAFDTPLILSDARIYRQGAVIWWNGGDLYKTYVHAGGNPALFTYPPFAVLPMAVIFHDFKIGIFFLMTGSVLALFHTCLLVIDRVRQNLPHRHLLAASVTIAAMSFEPVNGTLFWGQINLILLWLVAVDCLHRSPRLPRGTLIGLAAAIKLTPLAFVLFFLVGKDFKALLNSVLTFLACGALGFALTPSNSLDFWTRAIADPDRVGNVTLPANQSLRGLTSRFGLEIPTATTIWAITSAAVVLLAALAAYLHRRNGLDAQAWFALAAMSQLISPMSWSHHWVWLAPLVAAGVLWSAGAPWRLVPISLIAAAAVIAPYQYPWLAATPDAPWWHHVVAESYVWIGVLLLAGLLVTGIRQRSCEAIRTDQVSTAPPLVRA